MTRNLAHVFFIFLTVLSFSSYAKKIIITGQPVVLERQGNVYYLPTAYHPTTTYHYVNVDGANMVCYSKLQPALSAVLHHVIHVVVRGKAVVWNCYEYRTTHFQVRSG